MTKTYTLTEEQRYLRAKKQVTELKGFYCHLLSFGLVVLILIFINYMTFWGYKWFWYPAIGWGMGLAFHSYRVFVTNGILGREWENRQIEAFMEEDRLFAVRDK
jgi:hypothetical protein